MKVILALLASLPESAIAALCLLVLSLAAG